MSCSSDEKENFHHSMITSSDENDGLEEDTFEHQASQAFLYILMHFKMKIFSHQSVC